MSSIYIHIPFCNNKCYYCDFYSGYQFSKIDDFVLCLIKEISLRKNYLFDKKIKTIYFGGGTPSLLNSKHIKQIFNAINKYYDIQDSVEFSIEMNPENISKKYINELKEIGINRYSVGIQCFDNSVLQFLNRKHTKKTIVNSLRTLNKIEDANISVDIIYGIPNVSTKIIEQTINELLKYNISHISAYDLTISKNTKLYWLLKKNNIEESDESKKIIDYYTIHNLLKENNFFQYEISNYAKKGKFSNHNHAYWDNIEYIGFGPSAHSFNKLSRQWNVSNLSKYIHLINNNEQIFEKENLTVNDIYNEYILTTIRTYNGINIQTIKKNFPLYIYTFLVKNIQLESIIKYFIFNNDIYIPKEESLLKADYLAKFLMI